MHRYLIGIDLGTTNSALAFVDRTARLRGGRPALETFPVPQLVAAGEVRDRELLPSFLYRPGPHDLPAGATALPWNPAGGDAVGEFARHQGARVPGRLVSSAKSWLCHPGVDRTAALLPFGAPPDVPRLSPLAASAAYLAHLRHAWDHAGRAAGERLAESGVVLTVPASFDDTARTLTVEAAAQAGMPNVMLLEEPQAAFYCWLALAPSDQSARLKPGMNCLVVDVGGGTSDFSLIQSVEQGGELHFVREAVGDHLLLGGDNMDLALARHAESRLGGKLDAVQFAGLVSASRHAKEVMLSPDAPASHTVTVMGRGRSVIGGSLSAALGRDEVRGLLFDGFFPHASFADEPARAGRIGLQEMGLPYVADPGMTRHLAAFLRRHLADRPPDAVLFNGGVFQPAALRERVLAVMRGWYAGRAWEPLVLTTPSLDLAVSWGAAYYGWIKATGGKVIGGGTARSYYVGVDADAGDDTARPVLCVVPRHLEENQEVDLPSPVLELTLGAPVVFPLYTSTARPDDRPGQLLRLKPEQLKQLPPVHTLLRGGKRAGSAEKRVPVTLAARSTAIGTLELFCKTADGSQRWKLEFNAREEQDVAGSGAGNAFQELIPEDAIQRAGDLIRACYAGAGPDPKALTAELEAALDHPRAEWTTAVCRRLWEPLADTIADRRRTPAHFTRWCHLAGYVLRPGFGDPLDRYRVDTLWKLWAAPQGGKPPPADAGADVWIMWRRVAGGLNQPHQHALLDRMRPFLLPGKSKNTIKPAANELAELWRAAASLERLGPAVKGQLAEALLKQLRRPPAPSYALWALTRLGARVLLYGPLNEVVHPDTAAGWLDALLAFQPTHPSERTGWQFALAQLARMSGQRALDVDEAVRGRVLEALRSSDAKAEWIRTVEEPADLSGDDRGALFGESLPLGLRLAGG